MKGFVQTLSDGLALPAKEFVTSFELLAMIDLQLGAVLEHGALDKDPLADARENGGGDDGDENMTWTESRASVFMPHSISTPSRARW